MSKVVVSIEEGPNGFIVTGAIDGIIQQSRLFKPDPFVGDDRIVTFGRASTFATDLRARLQKRVSQSELTVADLTNLRSLCAMAPEFGANSQWRTVANELIVKLGKIRTQLENSGE